MSGARRSPYSRGGADGSVRRSISKRVWQSQHLYAGRSFVSRGSNGRTRADRQCGQVIRELWGRHKHIRLSGIAQLSGTLSPIAKVSFGEATLVKSASALLAHDRERPVRAQVEGGGLCGCDDKHRHLRQRGHAANCRKHLEAIHPRQNQSRSGASAVKIRSASARVAAGKTRKPT